MNVRKNDQVSAPGQSYVTVVAAVLQLLSELDPYGLEPGADDGAPADEYSFEASPMARLLVEHGKISDAQIDAIWMWWFNEPLSTIDANRFADFVTDVNALVDSPRRSIDDSREEMV